MMVLLSKCSHKLVAVKDAVAQICFSGNPRLSSSDQTFWLFDTTQQAFETSENSARLTRL